MMAWLTTRGLSTDLWSLRPQRVVKPPPRWFTREELRRLLGAVEQWHLATWKRDLGGHPHVHFRL